MKLLTREQVKGRKEKAVRFTRDVVGDPDRAEEIAEESLEDYAARRGFLLSNPRRPNAMARRVKTKEELQDEIDDLKAENEDLQDQLDSIADIVAPAEEDDDYGDEDDEDEEEDDAQD